MFFKKNNFLLILFLIFRLPFFSQEKEIAIPCVPDSLYGTLLISNSKFLCIFHSGSGPTDRNGNSEIAGENNSLKKLADSLYNYGISSFRYDKRSVGKSRDVLLSEDSLNIFTYVNDLNSVIEYFSNPSYGFKNFVLIGHSEGALIVTLSAKKQSRVKKLVLIAGAGFRGDSILKRQMGNLVESARQIIFPLIDSVAAGKKVENVPPILSGIFRESVQNYLRSWMNIDPAVELSQCYQKCLIIQGANDLQISVRDAERLKQFKKDAELHIFPKMNHILVDATKERKENFETYSKPELPLSNGLIQTIIEFLKK